MFVTQGVQILEFNRFNIGVLKERSISLAIEKVVVFCSPNYPQRIRKDYGPRKKAIELFVLNSTPCYSPVISLEISYRHGCRGGPLQHISPEQGGKASKDEYVVSILYYMVKYIAHIVNIDSYFGEGITTRQFIMVQEAHNMLDFVGHSQVPIHVKDLLGLFKLLRLLERRRL